MDTSYFYIQYNPERPLLCKYGHTTKPVKRNKALSAGFTNMSKYIFLAKLVKSDKYKDLDMYKIPDKIIYNLHKNDEYIRKIQSKFQYDFNLLTKEISKYLGKGNSGKELIFINGIQFLKKIILQDFSIMGIYSEIIIDNVDDFMKQYLGFEVIEQPVVKKNNNLIHKKKKVIELDKQKETKYKSIDKKIIKKKDYKVIRIYIMNKKTNKLEKKRGKKKQNENVKIYNCTECDKKYTTYQGMWNHKKKHHGQIKTGKKQKKPKCKYCKKNFFNNGNLKRHTKTCKKNPSNSIIDNKRINDNEKVNDNDIEYIKNGINVLGLGILNSKIL